MEKMNYMIYLCPVSKEKARRELVLTIVPQIRKDRILRESQRLLKRTLWFLKINQSSLSILIIKINPRSQIILFDMLIIKSKASSTQLGSAIIVEGMVI